MNDLVLLLSRLLQKQFRGPKFLLTDTLRELLTPANFLWPIWEGSSTEFVYQDKQGSPPCEGSGMEGMGPSLGSSVDFLRRRYPIAPNGLWCTTPSSSPKLGFGMQLLKDSGSVGDQSLQYTLH